MTSPELEVDAGDHEQSQAARPRLSPGLKSSIEWAVVIVGALGIALVIQAFLFQAYLIPSGSMEPTLAVGDRVLVNKLSDDPSRGDVIVFARPPGDTTSDIDDLIKRVIGLPGETLEAIDGQVYVDDVPLDEGYLSVGTTTANLPPTTVPEGTVFVMGDNRDMSFDSRFFGPIETSSIEGRAVWRIWPLGSFGGL